MTDIGFGLAFGAVNALQLVIASTLLVKLFAQSKELSRNAKRLTDLADTISSSDRHAIGQVARLAREISVDIGKLRDFGPPQDDDRSVSPPIRNTGLLTGCSEPGRRSVMGAQQRVS